MSPQTDCPGQPSPWLSICLATSIGGGAYALLVVMATCMLIFEVRISDPLHAFDRLVSSVLVSGVVALGSSFACFCLAVALAPVGMIAAWSLRVRPPAVYAGMVYSGCVAMLCLSPFFYLVASPTIWEGQADAALFMVAMMVGQLAGFYCRSRAVREAWSRERISDGAIPRISLRQGLASVVWFSLAFHLLRCTRVPEHFALLAHALVLLAPCVAWVMAIAVARCPTLPEQVYEVCRRLKTRGVAQLDPPRPITGATN